MDLVDKEKQQAEIKEKNAGCLLLAKLAWVCNNPPKKTTLLKATQIWRGRELPPQMSSRELISGQEASYSGQQSLILSCTLYTYT